MEDATRGLEESKQVRAAARKVLEGVESGSASPELAEALEKATAALKTAAEIERAGGEFARLDQEILKLTHENASAGKRAKSEKLRDYVTLLTPILTIVTLAATLLAQTWQFNRSEEAKREERLETQWQEAVKDITTSGALPPGIVALQPFLGSEKYGEQARDIAANLLATSSNQGFFEGLLGTALLPITQANLPRLLRVDRAFRARSDPLASKSWDAVRNTNDRTRLTAAEIELYDFTISAAETISAEIGTFLRAARPAPAAAVDLSGVWAQRCQWDGIDFSNVNLSNGLLSVCSVQGAEWKALNRFAGLSLYRTAWWEVNSINAALLDYLEQTHSWQGIEYGPFHRLYTREQYIAAVMRLRATL